MDEYKQSLSETVYKESIHALYRGLPSAVSATIVIAAVLTLVLWQVVDQSVLLVWLSTITSINIIRYISYWKYINTENHKNIKFWDNLFLYLLIVTGLCWSCVSIWLVPANDSLYHYFPGLVLIGMSAGAVTTLSYNMRNIVLYFMLVLIPLVVIEINAATFLSYSVAFLTLVFIVFALVNAKRINKTTVENITLRYHLEEERQQLIVSRNVASEASSAKSIFISMMSHELRTPLNAIMGFGQLLNIAENPELNEIQKDQVQSIINAGKHLLSLIEELLDLSKIETGKFNITLENVFLKKCISESIAIVSPIASATNIDIQNNIQTDFIVKANHKRIKQICINLLSNAIKYNNQNGNIKINAVKKEHGRIRVEITDTGDGLSAEEQETLFQPFQRFDNKKEGLGLGLYISQSLIESMNGTIGVESEVNKGCTFWFEINRAIDPE